MVSPFLFEKDIQGQQGEIGDIQHNFVDQVLTKSIKPGHLAGFLFFYRGAYIFCLLFILGYNIN
jgi:hypothetical protein